MQPENEALRLKVIDFEARSRRQNIKIIGLPEKIEGGRPREFLMKFIPELLGADHFHTAGGGPGASAGKQAAW